jgi:hypothetical protein
VILGPQNAVIMQVKPKTKIKCQINNMIRNIYLRDGIGEGKLCKVLKTFSTSPSLYSGLTSTGTESSTHSCSAQGIKH